MSNGYTRVTDVTVDQMELYGTWVAVAEDLSEKVAPSGLVTAVNKRATTVGRVLAVGVKVAEDLQPGDTILYEEWQGGRWNIGDENMLIMSIDNVLMVIDREQYKGGDN